MSLTLDFGRGGMVGLMGDLRGLSEGFIVVFVASVLPPAEEAL